MKGEYLVRVIPPSGDPEDTFSAKIPVEIKADVAKERLTVEVLTVALEAAKLFLPPAE